ncbi:hypothetical protein J6590_107004, partial [Homalodisca vitripennis]
HEAQDIWWSSPSWILLPKRLRHPQFVVHLDVLIYGLTVDEAMWLYVPKTFSYSNRL